MSQENVELVKAGWGAWLGGDLDTLFTFFGRDVEWDTTNFGGWPEDDVYRGHAGVRRFFDEWLASWERYEAGVDEYVDVGGDRVLVLCWQRGFGPGSHAPVEMEWAQVCTVRDGLISRMEAFTNRTDALEAVGLRE